MRFGNFHTINIQVFYFIHRCLKVIRQRVNKFFLTNVEVARNYLPITHDTFRKK